MTAVETTVATAVATAIETTVETTVATAVDTTVETAVATVQDRATTDRVSLGLMVRLFFLDLKVLVLR